MSNSIPQYPPSNQYGVSAWGSGGVGVTIMVSPRPNGPMFLGKGAEKIDVSQLSLEDIREHIMVCAEELGYPAFDGPNVKRGSARKRSKK